MEKIKNVRSYTAYAKEGKVGVWGCALQLVLIYLAVLATVLCFSTSLAMTVPIYEIVALCLLTTALFAVAFFNKITFGVFCGVTAVGAIAGFQVISDFFKTLNEAIRFCYDLGFVIMKMAGWNYTSHMLTSEEEINVLLEDEALVLSYFRSVVIVLAIFYALWFVALAWKRPRVWPTILVAVLVLVPGFCIGLAPAPVAFALLLSTAFGLYIQTLSGRKVHPRNFKMWWQSVFGKLENKHRFSYSAKSGIYGMCTAAISFIAMLIIALVTYQTPVIELEQVRAYLDDTSEYVYNQVFYARLETPDNAIGNLLDGDQLEVLKIPKFHNVSVMKVSSEQNQTVYLRSWVSDLFREDGWHVLDEQNDAAFQNAVPKNVTPYTFARDLHSLFVDERLDMDAASQLSYGFVSDTLKLKARFKKSDVVHLPTYGMDSDILYNVANVKTTAGDIARFTNGRPSGNQYTVRTFTPVITEQGYVTALHGLASKYMTVAGLDTSDMSETFQNFLKAERSYASYAKKTYTDISGMSDPFKEKAQELTENYKTRLTRVLAIERYFRDSKTFTYTIHPEQLQDVTAMRQIEYSLMQKKEGYCTYYATAMTMMVRSLGYPARYVNGYILRKTTDEAENDGGYRRTVMDTDSHAWVEVYFDGLGWLAFDPTPDESESEAEYSARYYALSLADGGGEETESTGPSGIDYMNPTYLPEQPEDPSTMPEARVTGLFSYAGMLILKISVALLILLALFVLYLYLVHQAKKHARDKYFGVYADEDITLTAKRMYVLILRWLTLYKLTQKDGETPKEYAKRVDSVLATEVKFEDTFSALHFASFSGHDVKQYQFDRIREYYDCLYQRLHTQKNGLAWWKQIIE